MQNPYAATQRGREIQQKARRRRYHHLESGLRKQRAVVEKKHRPLLHLPGLFGDLALGTDNRHDTCHKYKLHELGLHEASFAVSLSKNAESIAAGNWYLPKLSKSCEAQIPLALNQAGASFFDPVQWADRENQYALHEPRKRKFGNAKRNNSVQELPLPTKEAQFAINDIVDGHVANGGVLGGEAENAIAKDPGPRAQNDHFRGEFQTSDVPSTNDAQHDNAHDNSQMGDVFALLTAVEREHARESMAWASQIAMTAFAVAEHAFVVAILQIPEARRVYAAEMAANAARFALKARVKSFHYTRAAWDSIESAERKVMRAEDRSSTRMRTYTRRLKGAASRHAAWLLARKDAEAAARLSAENDAWRQEYSRKSYKSSKKNGKVAKTETEKENSSSAKRTKRKKKKADAEARRLQEKRWQQMALLGMKKADQESQAAQELWILEDERRLQWEEGLFCRCVYCVASSRAKQEVEESCPKACANEACAKEAAVTAAKIARAASSERHISEWREPLFEATWENTATVARLVKQEQRRKEAFRAQAIWKAKREAARAKKHAAIATAALAARVVKRDEQRKRLNQQVQIDACKQILDEALGLSTDNS